MSIHIGFERFRALDVAVRELKRQILRRVPGDAAAEGIEARAIEIVTIFIRLAPSERAAFDLYVAPLQTGGGDPERDVG